MRKPYVSPGPITTNPTVKTSYACHGKFVAATVLALHASRAAASTARRSRRSLAAAAALDRLPEARDCLGVELRVEAG